MQVTQFGDIANWMIPVSVHFKNVMPSLLLHDQVYHAQQFN